MEKAVEVLSKLKRSTCSETAFPLWELSGVAGEKRILRLTPWDGSVILWSEGRQTMQLCQKFHWSAYFLSLTSQPSAFSLADTQIAAVQNVQNNTKKLGLLSMGKWSAGQALIFYSQLNFNISSDWILRQKKTVISLF